MRGRVVLQLIILCVIFNEIGSFEPITTTVFSIGALAAGLYRWTPAKNLIVGSFYEVCSDKWIPMNIRGECKDKNKYSIIYNNKMYISNLSFRLQTKS